MIYHTSYIDIMEELWGKVVILDDNEVLDLFEYTRGSIVQSVNIFALPYIFLVEENLCSLLNCY